jgi:hypothetical protein
MRYLKVRLGTLLLLVVIAALAVALYTDRRRAALAEAGRQRRAAVEPEYRRWSWHSQAWARYADEIESKAAELGANGRYDESWTAVGDDPAAVNGLTLRLRRGDSAAKLREVAQRAREATARCARQAERYAAELQTLPVSR